MADPRKLVGTKPTGEYAKWLDHKKLTEALDVPRDLLANREVKWKQFHHWEEAGDYQRMWDAVLILSFLARRTHYVSNMALKFLHLGYLPQPLKRCDTFFRQGAMVYIGNHLLPLRDRLFDRPPTRESELLALVDAMQGLEAKESFAMRQDRLNITNSKAADKTQKTIRHAQSDHYTNTNRVAAAARKAGYR